MVKVISMSDARQAHAERAAIEKLRTEQEEAGFIEWALGIFRRQTYFEQQDTLVRLKRIKAKSDEKK